MKVDKRALDQLNARSFCVECGSPMMKQFAKGHEPKDTGWIKTEDQKPGEGEQVLFYLPLSNLSHPEIRLGYRVTDGHIDGYWNDGGAYFYSDGAVEYWMQLPELPEG